MKKAKQDVISKCAMTVYNQNKKVCKHDLITKPFSGYISFYLYVKSIYMKM